MKIIIAGAGNVGTHLAKLLSGEKQDIILMDEDDEKLEKMGNNLDLMLVNYSPTSINGLKEAGVAGADLFIAVTPDESRNMTACMLATNLGAKKTVARIDNYEYLLPKNKEFFAKLGVHSLIYPEMLAAREIVDAVKMSWIRQWWEFAGGALVLIGTHRQPLNLNCGYCGSPTCSQKTPETPCAFNSIDVGVAVGSACAVAASLHVDCRVMYSAGSAAATLGWPASDCSQVIAIPLSISSKNPFFDRKPKE